MSFLSVQPAISTTALTCATTVDSTAVTSSAQFGSVVAGQRILGAGIPFGTTVTTVTNDSNIVISKAATATSASVSLQFDYFTSAIYAAGDALGFPFLVGAPKLIRNIVVIDDVKQITAVKVLFFNSAFTITADNSAFAISDADAHKIVGYASLATSEVFSNNQIVTGTVAQFPLQLDGNSPTYCQLVCVGTPTFTAAKQLTVNIIYE